LTKSRTTAAGLYACPFCVETFILNGGEFPYLRSQIIQHLDTCAKRPADVKAEDITRLANRAAERLLSQQKS
jgi:hypothetical protein